MSQAAVTRKHLTSPTASATFPLLAPETTTGVYRSVVVPSPTCVEKNQHQPNTHIPCDTQQPPANTQQESLGPRRSFPSRILRLHSTVHKSEAAHITLEFHIPLKTQIWQHESHRSSQIDSKLYFTQSTATRESQNTSYPAQSKRCDATVEANSSYGCISVGSSVIADLQASQVISPKYISSETQNSPSNKTASITWPRSFSPQQKTVPLLDIAQE
jgi:hypothetical protein